MVANYGLENLSETPTVREIQFAGDQVFLSGQLDYPLTPMPTAGYPVLVVLHHAGGNIRADYHALAQIALKAGYAVFRWDKRGMGKSGGGARGSTLMDSVKAYRTAQNQPNINPTKTLVLGMSDGSLMLHDMYDQLATSFAPFAVLLIANRLDKREILKFKCHLKIVMGESDWLSWQIYGKEAGEAHRNAYTNYHTSFNIAQHADRDLRDTSTGASRIHAGAEQLITEWLKHLV